MGGNVIQMLSFGALAAMGQHVVGVAAILGTGG